MAETSMAGLPLSGLAESVLPYRTSTYITSLIDKLGGEGIVEPADLLGTSVQAFEMKLSTHAAFNHREVSDALSLRRAAERGLERDDAPNRGKGSPPRDNNRQRSRSANRRHSGSGQWTARRENSRPRRDFRDGGGRGSARGMPKPSLWQAVEEGDEVGVRRLLNEEGKDAEEKYQGWSPLMKAAEEGHAEIAKLLLDKGADMEVTNRKGRGALSFAAAPSMNGKVKRPTPTETLKLLLERGADTSRKDDDGMTAKQRAMKEKRDDAVAIFEEFEQYR